MMMMVLQFFRESEFNLRTKNTPGEEISLHTWEDMTLKELAELVQEQIASSRTPGHKFVFSTVFADQKGMMVMKDLGVVEPRESRDWYKTLHQVYFQRGDWLAVVIYSKRQKMN